MYRLLLPGKQLSVQRNHISLGLLAPRWNLPLPCAYCSQLRAGNLLVSTLSSATQKGGCPGETFTGQECAHHMVRAYLGLKAK